uniref:NADH-ubiquinone oxidoreductase chain 4L n=1 Tax=Nacella concinna TaxID=87956 RepID=A0A3S6I1D9_9GAST|nr:NADH dehydrogenase subunit 4L [Nacella concinna]
MMITLNMIMFISIILIITVIMSLIIQTSHIIMMLLLFETLALSVFMMIVYSMAISSMNTAPLIMFLTMSVCEASLGLSILVSILRVNGNDYVSTLATQKY